MVFLKISQNSQKNIFVGVSFLQLLRTFFYRIPLGDYCPSQSVSKVREKDLSVLLVSLLAEEIIILLHNQASMTFCDFSILSVSCLELLTF